MAEGPQPIPAKSVSSQQSPSATLESPLLPPRAHQPPHPASHTQPVLTPGEIPLVNLLAAKILHVPKSHSAKLPGKFRRFEKSLKGLSSSRHPSSQRVERDSAEQPKRRPRHRVIERHSVLARHPDDPSKCREDCLWLQVGRYPKPGEKCRRIRLKTRQS